jgi:hypothetical protein
MFSLRFVDCNLPKLPATEGRRSLCTPVCFCHGPDSDQRSACRASTPFTAFRSWKVFQFGLTFPAINTPLCLGAVPKTTAPFANFQLHAQFHDGFSVFSSCPARIFLSVVPRGEENQAATRDSRVLMGDYCLRSLAFCHARSAQILEGSLWDAPCAFDGRNEAEMGMERNPPGRTNVHRRMFIGR